MSAAGVRKPFTRGGGCTEALRDASVRFTVTDYGSRFTVYGSRFTVYDSRFTVNGLSVEVARECESPPETGWGIHTQARLRCLCTHPFRPKLFSFRV